MSFRCLGHHIKLWTDMDQFDPVPEQRDAAGTAVVAGIAVFENIDAAQFEPPFVVPRDPERVAGNRRIEELQAKVAQEGLSSEETQELMMLIREVQIEKRNESGA